MEAIISIIAGIVAIAGILLKYALSPDTKKMEEKRAFDEAIRKGDNPAMSALLSEQFDSLHKNDSGPGRPGA